MTTRGSRARSLTRRAGPWERRAGVGVASWSDQARHPSHRPM